MFVVCLLNGNYFHWTEHFSTIFRVRHHSLDDIDMNPIDEVKNGAKRMLQSISTNTKQTADIYEYSLQFEYKRK